MRTQVQTQAAATQFDGLTQATGLVNFADLPVPTGGENEWPVIRSISLENTPAAPQTFATIDCFLFHPATGLGGSARYTIRTLSAVTGFSLVGCNIPVPVIAVFQGDFNTPSFQTWQLALITTGKTLEASFVVTYGMSTEKGGC